MSEQTVPVAELVERALRRLFDDELRASKIGDLAARCDRMRELCEREARWWRVLLRQYPAGVPSVYSRAAVIAAARATAWAEDYDQFARRARERRGEVSA